MSRRSPPRRRIPLAELVKAWGRHHIIRRFRREPLLPRAMHMLVTGKCGSRCIMCGIWKGGAEKGSDLTLSEWNVVFGDLIFSRLEFVGLSGGEPFLRTDLAELIFLLHKHSPRLKRLSITTSGTQPDLMGTALEALVPYCEGHGLLLDISVSVHGIGEVFEKVTRVPKAFDRALRTLEMLKTYRDRCELTMSINAVLLRENLCHVRELAAWAREQTIPISFVIGEQRARFHNKDLASVFLGDGDRDMLIEFLREMGRDLSLHNLHSLRYRDLLRMMEKGERRSLPCYYALGGFVLGHDARLYYCSHSRAIGNCQNRPAHDLYYNPASLNYRKKELLGRECAACPPYTLTRWEIEVHSHRILTELLREKLRRTCA